MRSGTEGQRYQLHGLVGKPVVTQRQVQYAESNSPTVTFLFAIIFILYYFIIIIFFLHFYYFVFFFLNFTKCRVKVR